MNEKMPQIVEQESIQTEIDQIQAEIVRLTKENSDYENLRAAAMLTYNTSQSPEDLQRANTYNAKARAGILQVADLQDQQTKLYKRMQPM